MRSGQIISDKVRSGHIRSGRVGSGRVGLGQVRSGQFKSVLVRSDLKLVSSMMWIGRIGFGYNSSHNKDFKK